MSIILFLVTFLHKSFNFEIVNQNLGCKDQLPSKMTSDSNCKKLKKTCAKLKSKCSSKLGSAIGTSSTAKKCKNKLGSNANKKVRDFCKITCNQCGKLCIT